MPHSRLRLLLVPSVLLVTALVGAVVPAAADPPPALSLSADPTAGRAGVPVQFTATLTEDGGGPASGATVTLQRNVASTWTPQLSGVTGPDGVVVIEAVRPVGVAQWRAVSADLTSPVVTTEGVRFTSTLTLTGPARVVDETSVGLEVNWSTDEPGPVSGGRVIIQRRIGSGAWQTYTYVPTDSAGLARFTVAPRVDTRWRAVGGEGTWWTAATSPELFIDNIPAVAPVAYPGSAPRPAYTPLQARATGAGANAVITSIPASVWTTMVGRSWHRGCPVGRAGLRLLRVNYWGFDGYRYRGEIVLNAAVVGRAAAALRDMYDGRYPIRRMYRVDRFGWSRKLRGANDYASMRADNTSGFNCRSVVNRPGVRSPHATGRSIDLNTWENPYRSRTGLVPNAWWAPRSHPLVAWRSASHPVVRIWRSRGFRWTYGTNDSQHVDGRTMVTFGGFTG